MAWGVGGWILTGFLARIGPEGMGRLRRRIAAELTTTFASAYAAEVSLRDAIRPDVVKAWAQRATGGKYLVAPSRD